MNKLVQLVNLWAEFESQNPEAEIKDFCLDFILKDYQEKNRIYHDKWPIGEFDR
ncbi:MAG: hypothetical protein IPH28_05205 [Cytophagaceae bacterium]|nr:hypothetical protein [Cytophagaceae bacterium]